MLTLQYLARAGYAVKPWKNGLGSTLEIVLDRASPPRFRVSSADVPSSGPFSAYDGYERTLVLLEGGPMTLTHDGVPSTPLHPLDVEVFQGERVTSAVVETPARDLNVFTLRDHAQASVAVHRLPPGASLSLLADADEHLLYCVTGDTVVGVQTGSVAGLTLHAGDTARASRAEGGSATAVLEVKATSVAAVVFAALRLL